MIENGHINIQIIEGGGHAEDGTPIRTTKKWSHNIPAQIAVNTNSNVGVYIGGQFIVRSYTIDVDMQYLPPVSSIRIIMNGVIVGYNHTNPLPLESNGFDPNGTMIVKQNPQYMEHVDIIRIGV